MRYLLSTLTFALCLGAQVAVAQSPDLDALAQAARHAARDADAQTAYGRALLRAGRYRDAARTLKIAARLRHADPAALYLVAEVAFARRDYRASRAACRPIERAGRDSLLARVCRARAFLVWNRAGRAFEELEAALAEDPGNFDALFALGEAHRLRADVTHAEEAYRRAIAADTTRFEPHLGLGRLYAAARRHDDAVRELGVAARLDPASPDVAFELGRLSEGDDAIRLLQQAVTTRPGWADAQLALGQAKFAAGDTAGARAAFEAALRSDSRLSPAHVGLGRILAAAGDVEGAEREYRAAIELVANDAAAVLALGELYEASERTQQAFEQYQRAADLDPRDPAGLVHAARLALSQHRSVLATGFLDRLLRAHPRLAVGLALYGDALAATDRTRARDYYQRSLSAEGEVDRARVQAAIRELDAPRQHQPGLRRATVPGR
ncbi:MAG: tetratricopeptide repeat protein [Deltaproteobacteria bacterium]|nr:tetratricopeptide repeat protein [Deltaproteobacteria bacterium]